MPLKCPRCGGMMVRAIKENGAVLYECVDCDNYMIEYFGDAEKEGENVLG